MFTRATIVMGFTFKNEFIIKTAIITITDGQGECCFRGFVNSYSSSCFRIMPAFGGSIGSDFMASL